MYSKETAAFFKDTVFIKLQDIELYTASSLPVCAQFHFQPYSVLCGQIHGQHRSGWKKGVCLDLSSSDCWYILQGGSSYWVGSHIIQQPVFSTGSINPV